MRNSDFRLGLHFRNLDILCCTYTLGNHSMVTQHSLIETDLCLFSVFAVSDGPPSSNDQQNETAPFKLEATVPSRLALGARCGYSQRCWGSPVRQKKKHTGKFLGIMSVLYTEHRLYTVTMSTFSLISTLSDRQC